MLFYLTAINLAYSLEFSVYCIVLHKHNSAVMVTNVCVCISKIYFFISDKNFCIRNRNMNAQSESTILLFILTQFSDKIIVTLQECYFYITKYTID